MTMVILEKAMSQTVSKSRFKARALELFRQVERTGGEIIITDRGRPVLKIVPYAAEPARLLSELRETVVRYDEPEEPVAPEAWEALE
jgi:prevent-host-death family protein